MRTIQLETVNVVPFDNARLVARLHEATWTGGASPASVKVDGYDSYPSRLDAREFVATSPSLTATITTSSTAPAVASATMSNLPMALRFVLTLTQGSTGSAAFFVVVSADLILRTNA